MDPSQLRSAISTMKTVAISATTGAGATNTIIHDTSAGLYFVVFHLFLTTSAAVSVTIKSSTSTPLTGAIPMVAGSDLEWSGGDVPLFKGRAKGDDFVIGTSGVTDLAGFAVICEAT